MDYDSYGDYHISHLNYSLHLSRIMQCYLIGTARKLNDIEPMRFVIVIGLYSGTSTPLKVLYAIMI